ncbi:MAG: hypothetical protein ABIG67_04225 [Pseudomonadota bacterium]
MPTTTKASSRKRSNSGRRHIGKGPLEIIHYRDQCVVVDTASHFLFIGTLHDVTDTFITLRDADVHDSRESPSVKEKYILDSKKYGVRLNRKRVHIRFEEVISLSLLDDIIEY